MPLPSKDGTPRETEEAVREMCRSVELLRLYSNHQFPSYQFVGIQLVALAHPRASRSADRRQLQRKLSEPEVVELIAAYQQGALVRDLATRLGINRTTVTSLLDRHGVEKRQRGLTPDEVASAAQLYADGWSIAKIGRKFGVDGTTAWRALRAAGIVMRQYWSP